MEELFEFRDEYLSRNGIQSASKKNADVESKAKEVLLELDGLQCMFIFDNYYFWLSLLTDG